MYYVLFNCDEWKSSSSMSLRMVTQHKRKLLNTIQEEILNGNMCYTRNLDMYNATNEEMSDDFYKDTFKLTLDEELNHLVYGYVQYCEDGELQ